MNLSQRLDQARSRRQPAVEPTAYELRMTRDAQAYDGRHLRTGEEMTSEQWAQLRSSAGAGLPVWNPRRANDLVAAESVLDITDGGADVIDLRSHSSRASGDDEVFEMPAWARREQVFHSESE